MAAPGRRYLACWPGARGAVGGLSLELGAQRRRLRACVEVRACRSREEDLLLWRAAALFGRGLCRKCLVRKDAV